ncbi:MAG: DoxX family protein [Blastocatellia bacterium]|nr:DoxX family protein [Blastocatellia bacterium]
MLKRISLGVMALFYTAAGINHFVNPQFYLKIMPPYLPWHAELVFLSGVAEVVLGLALLIPSLRRWAAWGVIALLIAIYPANIYHLTSGGAGTNVPMWGLWLRLPFQFVFIWWAYWHTKEDKVTG